MTQSKTPFKSLLLGLGGALLATTACTITLDPGGAGGTEGEPDDAQCLELFETCVELAGESPGCDAVFDYCAGAGGDEGGVEPEPGCEQDYINCLAEGVDPEACQPLLDACDPGGGDEGGDEGGGCGDDPDGCEPPPPCDDGDPACGETDCEQLAETCAMLTGSEDACYGDLLQACFDGDCGTMLNACYEFGGDEVSCAELTGCGDDPEPPNPDDCDSLLNECFDNGGDEELCLSLYPECFEPMDPAGPGEECEWYSEECQGQFADQFCAAGQQACQVGFLPDVFECSLVFPDFCAVSGLDEAACDQGEEACLNGFFDTMLCASLEEDPTNWLQNLAECNDWG